MFSKAVEDHLSLDEVYDSVVSLQSVSLNVIPLACLGLVFRPFVSQFVSVLFSLCVFLGLRLPL